MIRGVALVITLSSCAFETTMPGEDDLPGKHPVGGLEEDHVPGLGDEQRLTNDPSFGASSFGNARTVIANGNTLHVIWFDERSKTGLEPDFETDPNCFKCTRSAREIYTRRSLDRGMT